MLEEFEDSLVINLVTAARQNDTESSSSRVQTGLARSLLYVWRTQRKEYENEYTDDTRSVEISR